MADNSIKCPNCGTEIALTEALTGQIRDDLRKNMESEFKVKEQAIQKKLQEAQAKEADIAIRAENIEAEIAEKIEAERKRIASQEFEKAQKSLSLEFEDLQSQLKDKSGKLEEAKKTELALRKKERDLEEAKQNLELETERRVAVEKEKIRKDALQAAAEQQKLTLLDYENKINGLKEQIDILKQKAEQGSQQAQGETLELELEDALRQAFPEDNITPVPKGITGADVVHEIRNAQGASCGKIIWESKRTKGWSDGWLDKLKSDQRKAKADIAVILTVALPKGVETFGLKDGVWVTNYSCAIGLALSLRQGIIRVAASKAATIDKGKKMEYLYAYLSGPEFKGRVESMLEAFIALREELDQERRAVTKLWAQREKQIERVFANLSGMYGDFQGIIGASLPQIKNLELKALPGAKD